MIGVLLGQITQHRGALVLGVAFGFIEAQQQFPQGLKHLLCQARAHVVLAFAAFVQQLRQPLIAAAAEHPVNTQQHLQGAEHGPARHGGHRLQREGDVAAGFTARSKDQAQCFTVEQQPNRVFAFFQKALKAVMR